MTNNADIIGVAVVGVIGMVVAGVALSIGFGGSNSSGSGIGGPYEIQRDTNSSVGDSSNLDDVDNYSDYDSQRGSVVSNVGEKYIDVDLDEENGSIGGSRRRKHKKSKKHRKSHKKTQKKHKRRNK
jgi:hypothetical protein